MPTGSGAVNQAGLDFYDVVFEMLDYDQLNEVASYGGFPTRYPHWRFGMDYEELAKSYSYGLSKKAMQAKQDVIVFSSVRLRLLSSAAQGSAYLLTQRS